MKRILTTAALLAAAVQLGLLKSTPAHAAPAMEISPDAERPPAAGPEEYFTGNVLVKPLFGPNDHRNTGAGQVTFSPCARSAWIPIPLARRSSWRPEPGGCSSGAARSSR